MSLSTLRPPISSPSPRSLLTLTDDSLLLLFTYLPVPQCITLLSTSRRFYSLLRQTILPAIRSLLVPSRYLPPPYPAYRRSSDYRRHLQLTFSRRYRPPSHSYQAGRHLSEGCPHRGGGGHLSAAGPYDAPWSLQFSSQRLVTLLPTLPDLCPRLQAFTFRCSFSQVLRPVQETENRLLSGYLASHAWSHTLLSLHLLIHLGIDGGMAAQAAQQTLFRHLNGLVALEHLTLTFASNASGSDDGLFTTCDAILPETLPILGQLRSFSLRDYFGNREVSLLEQLGPGLSLLSVKPLCCTVNQFADFLRGHPSYRTTLTTLDLSHRHFDWQQHRVFPLLGQYLPSLERLFYFPYAKVNIPSSIHSLASLPRLRELRILRLSLSKLEAIARTGDWHLTLPRLSSVRQLTLHLKSKDNGQLTTEPNPLFDRCLSLLGHVFPAVVSLKMTIKDGAYVREHLLTKVRQHWTSVRKCELTYS